MLISINLVLNLLELGLINAFWIERRESICELFGFFEESCQIYLPTTRKVR